MEAKLPKPVHESYRKHRKDLTWKILFPVILSSVLCVALIVVINLVTFTGGGDVARWGAISTMWIAIPAMLGLLIVLALVVGMIYLMARLLNITPNYTLIAQDFFHKVESYAKRGAEAAVKPIISLNSIGAGIGKMFGRR